MSTYTPNYTDFNLSPFTGMTRKSWVDAGKYLLEGIFRHIPDLDSPVLVPRREMKITYPHPSAPKERQELERRAEIFEGLARSFLLGSVLIKEEPDLELCGIPLSEYYKRQILRCVTRGDELYVGNYTELVELSGTKDPFCCFQQTVETCALVTGLWASREQIWDRFSPEEKGRVTDFLSDYAHANTAPQNWRFFNMLDLAFLSNEGCPVDEALMLDHAQALLSDYAGDGWYRDGQSFDYYSCWAFQVYAPLWNSWWGYEHAPEIAAAFEEHSHELMKTYCRFFDRDGFVNMWGRSCIYRFAAISAFAGNLFLKKPSVDCGWARRIASGALLQFLSRDDFLEDGVPSMGFYGQFGPMIQSYSCAESVLWLAKAFLFLHFPEDHPFWRAEEREGDWEGSIPKKPKATVLDGPGLLFTNHPSDGSTLLRTGKVMKQKEDLDGIRNYAKLSYHTKYPWEGPVFSGGVFRGDVESMQYMLQDGMEGSLKAGNALFWAGERDQILYRKLFFGLSPETEMHWVQAMDLADFVLPCGIFRADRLHLCKRPVKVTLGSYGFPDNGTEILRKEKDGQKAVILTGKDHIGRHKQMAMTIFAGFEELEVVESSGSNPDSPRSLILLAKVQLNRQYDAAEPYALLSQVITRDGGEPFSEEELFPVKEIGFSDRFQRGAYGPAVIRLLSGEERIIDFTGMEGRLML